MGERLPGSEGPGFELTTEPFDCQAGGFQSKVEAKKHI